MILTQNYSPWLVFLFLWYQHHFYPWNKPSNNRLTLKVGFDKKPFEHCTYTVDIHFMTAASFVFLCLRTLTSFYFMPSQVFSSVRDAGNGVLESKISCFFCFFLFLFCFVFVLFCFVLFCFFFFFFGGGVGIAPDPPLKDCLTHVIEQH